MAEINVAYDLMRSGAWQRESAAGGPVVVRTTSTRRAAASAGAWLADPIRRALGGELLLSLEESEDVSLVTPAATWASPRTLLAVSDRRLLWLLDDAPVARVRAAPLRDVAEVEARSRRPRRRVATLQLKMTSGRRHAFAELRPHTAATIERQVRAARGR